MIDLLKQFVALDIPVSITAIFGSSWAVPCDPEKPTLRKALSVATKTTNAKTQFS